MQCIHEPSPHFLDPDDRSLYLFQPWQLLGWPLLLVRTSWDDLSEMSTMLLLVIMFMGLMSCRSSAACGATSELAACLPAAEADVQPTSECCTLLSTYVSSDGTEDCLCQAASSSAFNASGAALEYAVTIPEKCNLTFPAGTQCNGVTIPGGQ